MFWLLLIVLAAAIFLNFIPDDRPAERFAGSDWNTAVWGASLWNGWNYGAPPPRRMPVPERT